MFFNYLSYSFFKIISYFCKHNFDNVNIMRQKAFRLSSLEDPSDEQLYAWMKQVGEAARESSRRAEKEMKRRLQNVKEMLILYKKADSK